MTGAEIEEPAPVVPDPVTFREFAEQGEYEGEIISYDVEKDNIGRGLQGVVLVGSGKGFRGPFEWRARSEEVLEYAAAVIPYGVVFRIYGEKFGSKMKYLEGKLAFLYLRKVRQLGITTYKRSLWNELWIQPDRQEFCILLFSAILPLLHALTLI